MNKIIKRLITKTTSTDLFKNPNMSLTYSITDKVSQYR